MNNPINILTEILLEKYGEKIIKGVLTGEYIITDKPPTIRSKRYSRQLQEEKDLFCECKDGKHEWCASPAAVIQAIEDAREIMNYSNWAADKFDRAIELIFRHCEDNEIPLQHKREVEADS